MACNLEFIQYICEQVASCGVVSYKKMFGEYMVYVNAKPIILVCGNTPYVKINDVTDRLITNKQICEPYIGAKPHYILDVDDKDLVCSVITELEEITPLPKVRKSRV